VGGVILLAHRGYSAKYPENTILAFRKALEAGADGVELDVWLSRDGKVVVMHDETIDRTSNLHGRLKDMTLDELSKAELGMGQRIPLLEEVIEALPNAMINVEIKDPDVVEAVEKLIRGIEDRIIISSFDVDSLLRMRELNGRVRLGYLIAREEGLSELPKLLKVGLWSVNVPIDAIPVLGLGRTIESLKNLKGLGLKVVLWAHIEELFYNYLPYLAGLFDVVITNDVPRMAKLLKEMKVRE